MSDITDTNASLITELNESKSKLLVLEKQIDDLQTYSNCNGGSNDHIEEIDSFTRTSIKTIVKQQLFPRKKFISQKELSFQHDNKCKVAISSFILDKLRVPIERRFRFWNTYKVIVHSQILETRSNRIHNIKKKFIQMVKDVQRKFM